MRIGLGLYFLSGFDEALMRGIASYARPNRPWAFDLRYPTQAGLSELLTLQPSGILVRSSNADLIKWLARSGLPIVNLDPTAQHGVSSVANDDVAIGRMAAAYYIRRGFVNFACFRSDLSSVGSERLRGFAREIEHAGAICHQFPSGTVKRKGRMPDGARGEWLTQLPKPIGIFCVSDDDARTLGEHAKTVGIQIPEQVALLGTDNDLPTCSLGHPQLSSIQTAGRRIGYEASRVLDEMIKGAHFAEAGLRVPPVRVVSRRSSEIMGTPDEVSRQALEYLAAHYTEDLGVEHLAAYLQCSRRALERRFQATALVSPAQALVGFRVEEASRLLADTDLPLALVAELSGLGRLERLSEAMRKVTGLTATQFRQHAAP